MIPIVYHVLSANAVAYHEMGFHDAQSVLPSIYERQLTSEGTSKLGSSPHRPKRRG